MTWYLNHIINNYYLQVLLAGLSAQSANEEPGSSVPTAPQAPRRPTVATSLPAKATLGHPLMTGGSHQAITTTEGKRKVVQAGEAPIQLPAGAGMLPTGRSGAAVTLHLWLAKAVGRRGETGRRATKNSGNLARANESLSMALAKSGGTSMPRGEAWAATEVEGVALVIRPCPSTVEEGDKIRTIYLNGPAMKQGNLTIQF